jgi:hypothetical protein
MRKTLILAAFALLSCAAAAEAATANFQANCNSGIPTFCVFDPFRTPAGQTGTSCPGGAQPSAYFWDYGDGSSQWVIPPPHTASHTYNSGISTDVCVTVFCPDGSSATKCHCFSNVVGVNGCIRPGAGWTP